MKAFGIPLLFWTLANHIALAEIDTTEDKAALEELRKAEAQSKKEALLKQEKSLFFKEQGIDFRELEADELLMPPGMGGRPKFVVPVQENDKNIIMEVGMEEYNSIMNQMNIQTRSTEPSTDAYELFNDLIRSASSRQYFTSSSASSFSFSFAPPSSTTSFTFSTTATAPSAVNTILPDVGRQESWHYKNATSYMMGGMFPLSVNGTALLSGVQYAEAFRCAINIVNSNSRVLRTTLLTYLIEDSEGLPSAAANQALLFNRRELSMVIGPGEYDSLPPVANLYNNVTLPFISYAASGVQYSNGTVYPSFFRTIPSDLATARAMAEAMKLFGWNYVAAIFTTDSYGQSGRTALLQQIGRQRLKVTCVNQIDPGSVRGLPNFADCVARSDASVVVLWMDEFNAANTLSYLYQNATNTRLTFMAPDRWALIQNPSSFNDTLPRTNYTFPLSFIEGTLGFVPLIGSLSLYKACASAVSPANTNYPAFNQVWQREFRCIINASDTVPLCPASINERVYNCRCTGEENLANLPINPKVNYVMDSVNVFATTLDKMINNCGQFPVGSWCNRSIIASSDILQAIPQLSFRGLTGVIAFNQTRPDRRRSFLDLYQYNAAAVPHQVGFWNLSGPFYAKSLLVFKTYPSVPISILVPENTEFGSSFWTSAVCVMAIVGIALAIFLIVFFITFKSSRVVRRANIHFIVVMLSGIIMVLASLVIWTLKQSSWTCLVKTILGMVGFGLIVGCIVAKCQRYFRVFASFGYVPPRMTTLEFYLCLTLPLLLSVAIMALYNFGKGIPQAVVTQSTVDNTYVYISCLPGTKDWGTTLVAIFIGVMVAFIAACTAVLLLCLNLVTPYKESTFLLLICLDFIVLLLLLVPLYYTVGDRRGSALQTFLLRSLGQLFAMFLTMGLLFVPKLIYVLRAAKRGDKPETADNMAATSNRVSMTADTTMTGQQARNVTNYTEFSSSDNSESDYDAGGITGVSQIEDGTVNRPASNFASNMSRGSTGADGSMTMTGMSSAGSGTAPTSYMGDTGFTSEATQTNTDHSGTTGLTSAGTRTTAGMNDELSNINSGTNTTPASPRKH